MMQVLNCQNESIDISKSSSSSLAERRRIAISLEKLSLYTQLKPAETLQPEVLKRLQDENAKLPTQVK